MYYINTLLYFNYFNNNGHGLQFFKVSIGYSERAHELHCYVFTFTTNSKILFLQ